MFLSKQKAIECSFQLVTNQMINNSIQQKHCDELVQKLILYKCLFKWINYWK